MAKAIFNVLFKIIKTILDVGLAPVNLLVANLFPDFAILLSTFNNNVSRYVGGMIGYFSYMIPPTTKSLITLYLTFLISYYTISYAVHGVVKIFKIIQRIKFW